MAIEDWVESNIDSNIKHTGSGREIHICCPMCGETKYRMYINLNNGKVHCQKCKFSATNFVNFIKEIEGTTYQKALQKYKDIAGGVIPEYVTENLVNKILKDTSIQLIKRPVALPDEYEIIDLTSNNLRIRQAIRYLQSRKITKRQIREHKVGFCSEGEFENRTIIPIYNKGRVVFWVSRAISDKAYLKEISPVTQDYNISKSEVLFNLDIAVDTGILVLSEGIFDAMSWGDIGVGLLGKILYTEQYNQIIENKDKIKRIYVALDFDAYSYAVDIAKILSEVIPTYIVKIPQHLDDPNKALIKKGKDYMPKLLYKAEKYSEFSRLSKLLAK